MGKIIKLKNKKTGEHVYPVSVTKAIADPDSGERLNDILHNKVEEAPMDGAQYVRKNGTWAPAEIATDPNEICRIKLVSNQGDADNASLNGATIKVENTVTGEVIYNGAWNGTEVELKIAGATKYKVTVGSVANYLSPEAVLVEALPFSSRDIIFTYKTEVVSVNVVGLASGFNITIKSNDGTTIANQTTPSASYKIPFGTSYSISASSVTGYRTPNSSSYVAEIVSRSVELSYEAKTWEDNPGLGVYIEDTEGHLWKSENWVKDWKYTPNSVVIKGVNCSARFALTFRYRTMVDDEVYTAGNSYDQYMQTFGDANSALLDINGNLNTTNMLKVFSKDDFVAKYCSSFIFPAGQKGFVPAAGQANLVAQNRNAFDACYVATGFDQVSDAFWTSTYGGLNGSGWPIFYITYTDSIDKAHSRAERIALPVANY